MFRTLIIYESTYGSTEEVASKTGMILGPSRCCRVPEFQEPFRDFEFFVIGSGVYRGRMHPRITDFIRENPWLREKPVALFSVSLSREDGLRAIKEVEDLIGGSIYSRALGGRMKLGELSEEDLADLQAFSEVTGIELSDVDLLDKGEVTEFALELRDIRDSLMTSIDEGELRGFIDEFLRSHNTCTLATCHGGQPRATPLEYIYDGDSLLIISEGGEKFAGLPENERVSVAVYEDYTSMSDLAGMQITGAASILHGKDAEHVYKLRGLNPDAVKDLNIDMNVIRIDIRKVEFLNSKFRALSACPKQVLWVKKD
ncbi:MAG: pyridoxamine 5'-phosphate oxidase family protein [Methanothermobacter sp.]|nr:pyridoxamine 5'-phosphate oxidase family protein [Methanothermobacter sp.]